MFTNGSDPTTYMTNPIFSHYDVILPIAIEFGFDPVTYMTDEAMGRVPLVIRSEAPNPGPTTIVLRLTTEEGTATGKGGAHTSAQFRLASQIVKCMTIRAGPELPFLLSIAFVSVF